MSLKPYFKSMRKTLSDAFDDDRMTITRKGKTTKPNGATGFGDIIIDTDIPCHYSQTSMDSGNQTISTNDIEFEHKITYDPSIDIQAGDIITVNIKDSGVTRVFVRAGKPVIGYSRNSVTLKYKDKA